MSIVPSPASFARLTGNFSASALTVVYVMSYGEFGNYSKGSSSFFCPSENACWQTGPTGRGTVDVASLPIYWEPMNGITVEPWYIVMHDANATAASSITWTTNLTAVYEDIYAGRVVSAPGPTLVARSIPD